MTTGTRINAPARPATPAASCIVTGGAGFIGCNLVKALNARGCTNIVVVDRLDDPRKEKNLAILRYREYLDKQQFRERLRAGTQDKPDTVFHLGACSSTTETDENYLKDNNFEYTRELCEWSLQKGVRFVYASSAATYGDGALGFSDDVAKLKSLRPLNAYGWSKHRFDLWALEQGILDRIAGLKYFNVYGPHENHKDDMRSVVNKAYREIRDTGSLRLFKSYRPEYADGCQERDFLYVDDAVACTLFFGDNPGVGGLFNCGTGTARTWLDLARAVFTAMNVPQRILFTEMPDSIRDKYQYHTRAEVENLRRAGYTRPFASVEQGVTDYVRNHLAKTEQPDAQ